MFLKRFGMVAIMLAAVCCGALLVGCADGSEDEDDDGNNIVGLWETKDGNIVVEIFSDGFVKKLDCSWFNTDKSIPYEFGSWEKGGDDAITISTADDDGNKFSYSCVINNEILTMKNDAELEFTKSSNYKKITDDDIIGVWKAELNSETWEFEFHADGTIKGSGNTWKIDHNILYMVSDEYKNEPDYEGLPCFLIQETLCVNGLRYKKS